VKSWTRTLNIDDAHSLLACAEHGLTYAEWKSAAKSLVEHLSVDRQRELFRILRDQFLTWNEDGTVDDGLFMRFYNGSPATAQIDLLDHQWALSHEISLIALRELIGPALESNKPQIALADLDALVARHIDSRSSESLRKTRTVLLGALEGTGTLTTRGTGQHRSLRAARGRPHPAVFAYLVQLDLQGRGAEDMMASEAVESSLGVQASLCTTDWAGHCVSWAIDRGLLAARDDTVGLPRLRLREA